jgi:predicted nucleotidyltransferase
MSKTETIDILKKYIALLNNEGFDVSQAFLFGSFSTNKAREDSDIDVLIVSNKLSEPDDQKIGKAWMLTRKVNSRIEPLFINADRFYSNENSPLIENIKEKGIKIV